MDAESSVEQILAVFPDLPHTGAAGAFKDANGNIERAIELVLNNHDKYQNMKDSVPVRPVKPPVDVPVSPVAPQKPPPQHHVPEPSAPPMDPPAIDPADPNAWLEKLRQEQIEIERQLALKKQKEREDQEALALAATLKMIEEEERQRRLEEEKRSEAIIAALMAEQEAARLAEEENEKATKALLEQERRQRERELEQRKYPCQICSDEYILPSMFVCSSKESFFLFFFLRTLTNGCMM
jgi:hypothetical protein